MDYDKPFDIGMATHLCGGATDVAQLKAMKHRAVFVLTPCCMGKIRHSINNNMLNKKDYMSIHEIRREQDKETTGDMEASVEGGEGVVYPRSEWLRTQLALPEYIEMIRLSDHSEKDSMRDSFIASKRLMDADRCTVAAEAGYTTVVGRLWPPAASPKNDVLVGAPVALQLAGCFRGAE